MEKIHLNFKKAQNSLQNMKYKESYNLLLDVTKQYTSILENEIQWENDIILRKPDEYDKLFQRFHMCLNIMNNVITTAAFQNSIPIVQINNNQFNPLNSNVNIPLIPLSPLTAQILKSSHNLQINSKRLALAKEMDSLSLTDLRNLIESVSMYENQIKRINEDIQKITFLPVFEFDADIFAKQLTVINCRLFKKLNPRDNIINLNKPQKSKNDFIKNILDFSKYLKHMVIHIILKPNENIESTENERCHAIQYFLTVAHFLYQKYRNFSALLDIISALSSIEVQRLTKSWELLDSKSKNNYDFFSKVLLKDYDNEIKRMLSAFPPNTGNVIAIPDISIEVENVNTIFQQYDTGCGLNKLGEEHLNKRIELLEICQGKGTYHEEQTQNNSRPIGLLPNYPNFLSELGLGDHRLEHWILTRIYYTLHDLWNQSVQCEPLKENEVTPEEATTSTIVMDTENNFLQINNNNNNNNQKNKINVNCNNNNQMFYNFNNINNTNTTGGNGSNNNYNNNNINNMMNLNNNNINLNNNVMNNMYNGSKNIYNYNNNNNFQNTNNDDIQNTNNIYNNNQNNNNINQINEGLRNNNITSTEKCYSPLSTIVIPNQLLKYGKDSTDLNNNFNNNININSNEGGNNIGNSDNNNETKINIIENKNNENENIMGETSNSNNNENYISINENNNTRRQSNKSFNSMCESENTIGNDVIDSENENTVNNESPNSMNENIFNNMRNSINNETNNANNDIVNTNIFLISNSNEVSSSSNINTSDNIINEMRGNNIIDNDNNHQIINEIENNHSNQEINKNNDEEKENNNNSNSNNNIISKESNGSNIENTSESIIKNDIICENINNNSECNNDNESNDEEKSQKENTISNKNENDPSGSNDNLNLIENNNDTNNDINQEEINKELNQENINENENIIENEKVNIEDKNEIDSKRSYEVPNDFNLDESDKELLNEDELDYEMSYNNIKIEKNKQNE